mmetsp:Transcript_9538/g.20916  ORF Transcript_9538/g.20916 Transcript_9538/m.20916 type:complete len:592 (-) Transcript_9538:776-2551(-)
MVREEADRLVHLHLDLPPPVGLDERRALDHELQPGELDPLEGAQLEEDHGLPHGEAGAVLRLRDAQLRVQVLQQLLRPDLRVVEVPEARDYGGLGDDLVVVPALLVIDADRVAGAADLHDLQHAAVAELLRHALPVVEVRQVLRVGLDAPDEVGLRQVHDVHEAGELVLELGGDGVLFLLLRRAARLLLLGREHLRKLPVLLEEVGDEGVAAACHALDDVVAQLVLVLVEERVGAVLDGAGEVLDDEPGGLRLDLVEAPVALVLLHQLVAEALVGALRHDALLVEDREDSGRLGLQDVDGVRVVGEVEGVPGDALAGVKLLLELEDEGVEELLQPLVGEVDAELLEGVHLEALEAEDVEDADEELHIFDVADGKVSAVDDEFEDDVVQRLRECIAVVSGLADVHGALDLPLPGDLARHVAEGRLQHLAIGARELRGHLDGGAALAHYNGTLAVVRRSVELGVAELQHGSYHLEHLRHLLSLDAYGLHGVDAALKHLDVVDVLQRLARRAREVGEVPRVREALQVDDHLLRQVGLLEDLREAPLGLAPELRGGRARLVEDVVVPLALLLVGDADLLEQVGRDAGATEAARGA